MDSGSPAQGGRATLDGLAGRHGLDRDAVEAMLRAVIAGGGSMAQFDIPALGGYGQWMRGGMTMVGNMFDNELRARVDRLATELATLYFDPPFALQRELAGDGEPRGTDTGAPTGAQGQSQRQGPGGQGGSGSGSGGSGHWWPDGLGSPSTAGAQNDSRYAYFPASNRLAVQKGGGAVELYDTTGHAISGVSSQSHNGSHSVTFSGPQGSVPLDRLPRIGGAPAANDRRADAPAPADDPRHKPAVPPQDTSAPPAGGGQAHASPATGGGGGHAHVLDALERLGGLKEKGILTEAEFADKKRDLLSRL